MGTADRHVRAGPRATVRWPRRRTRSLLGALAVTASLLGLVAGSSTVAAETEEAATINRQAYFTHPATQVVPPVLVEGFPPSTACLVAGIIGIPQVCGQEVGELADALGLATGLPVPTSPDGHLVQPVVVPGTLPVGMLGGQQRYVSLLRLDLPSIPPDEELVHLELVLHQDGLNFALESPAFRALILAAISQLGDGEPSDFADVIQEIATGDTEVFTESITGIEACPATDDWDAGNAQNAGEDGSLVPRADCILGANGAFDPTEGTWTFDLTFAAQAWTTGGATGETVPNHGIVLRPVGAPNVAYGDPDLSTNWVVSLADGTGAESLAPQIRWSTVPAALDAAPAPLPDPAGIDPGAPAPATGAPTGLVPAPAPAPVPQPQPPAPAVGAPSISARWAEPISTTAGTPGGLWLLVPLGLAGAALLGESAMSRPAAVQRRPGAMSRLMRARGVAGAAG